MRCVSLSSDSASSAAVGSQDIYNFVHKTQVRVPLTEEGDNNRYVIGRHFLPPPAAESLIDESSNRILLALLLLPRCLILLQRIPYIKVSFVLFAQAPDEGKIQWAHMGVCNGQTDFALTLTTWLEKESYGCHTFVLFVS